MIKRNLLISPYVVSEKQLPRSKRPSPNTSQRRFTSVAVATWNESNGGDAVAPVTSPHLSHADAPNRALKNDFSNNIRKEK
ncbi:hypothetical protein PanWU01x14_117970 [Parasponia andersonii]|uniref:Uncharacterized protein n=1 Tax=Parasponia andersonii TaxID=3476 RepID=A0A2P5CW57_PARAD|nr:hypothetical protein PanWU01x14_117970 [Parasponia andersonii]